MLRTALRFAAPLLALAGCVDPGASDDDENVLLGGKGDGAFEITVTELSEMLDSVRYSNARYLHETVGISERAAQAIERIGLGPDGNSGTSDDVQIRTLEQLDEIPYVTKSTLETLRDFARARPDFPAGASERWH